MSSIANSDTLAWSDDQTRFYLQLQLEEEMKGNVRKGVINEAGRRTITEKFYEAYGERHAWRKFGIKYSTCKTQYDSFKRLTRNKTGLGYHPNGSLNMTEDWWSNGTKEWPGALKIKEKALANIDLMEKVFGSVHISGAEGWTAQQGEEHLDKSDVEVNADAEAKSESRQIPPPTQDAEAESESRQIPPPTQDADMSNGPSSSSKPKASRKRSRIAQARQAVAEVIRDSVQSRDKILSHKNNLIENHPEFSCSQLKAMEVLHSLPIRMWSPLYKAAIQHLIQDIANRQTFLFYKDDENKILYLEFATGESRDA